MISTSPQNIIKLRPNRNSTLAVVHSAVLAQEKLPRKAAAAVETYEKEIDAIEKECEARRLAARTKLDETLLTQQKAALAAGDTEDAKRIERERADIAAINDRVGLHNALVGHTFQWNMNRTRWKFHNDGTITAQDSRFPWVTLNGNEVLLIMNDGSLRILRFNKDRNTGQVAVLPSAKVGKDTLKLVR